MSQSSPQRASGERPSAGALVSAMVAFVRIVAQSNRGAHEEMRTAAKRILEDLDSLRAGTTRDRGHPRDRMRAQDAWMLDIVSATEKAIPRETLLAEFQERYRRERRVEDHARHDGPWLFLFVTEHEHGQVVAIRPEAALGVNAEAFQRLCALHLPNARDDPFLGPVMYDGADIDAWYAALFGGSPLFDRLLATDERFAGESDYWVNAVHLPGDGRYESRGVFVIHRNPGNVLQPDIPADMRQDQRVLAMLALTWRQLEHQVKALAALSEANRRELINLIAPGLMHHEIGAMMRSLYSQAYQQFELLKRTAIAQQAPEDSALAEATRYAHAVGTLALRLFSVTDAFNNLDKRSPAEEGSLYRMFGEIRLLLNHRLGAVGVEFSVQEQAFRDTTLVTDIVLAEQALINIVNNALNMISEDGTAPPRRISAYIESTDERCISLAIVNNGPAVPVHLAQSIFRRGFTTRAHGHGQGLYLARLVAHYLGGDLVLMEAAALPEGFHAGFRFSLLRKLPVQEGLGRAAG